MTDVPLTSPPKSPPPRRRYWSTYVVGALTLGGLFLAIAPGDLRLGGEVPQWEHGWPWPYLTRNAVQVFPAQGSTTGPGMDWHHVEIDPWYVPWTKRDPSAPGAVLVRLLEGKGPEFRLWILLADVIVAGGITALVCYLWTRWRRQRMKVYQWHIRDLLFVTAVAALGCTWWVRTQHRCNREREAVTSVKDSISNSVSLAREPVLPGWVLPLLLKCQIEPFERVVKAECPVFIAGPEAFDCDEFLFKLKTFDDLKAIRLNGPLSDSALAHFGAFQNLRQISLRNFGFADAGVAQLAQCPELSEIELRGAHVAATEVRQLRTLPRLRGLYLTGVVLADDGAEELGTLTQLVELRFDNIDFYEPAKYLHSLRTLPRLERLSLSGKTRFNMEDIAAIAELPKLRVLELGGLPITDYGLTLLKCLPRLEELDIQNCSDFTAAGVAALKEAKPQLRIVLP